MPNREFPFPFFDLLKTGKTVSYLTFAVVSLLCLVFPPARIYGAIGWTLLLIAYPYWTLGVILAAGIAYYYLWR